MTTTLAAVDRLRLEALRYAVNGDEAVHYIAIMRTFTSGTAGLLSDQSAGEVAARLAQHGLELDVDTVEARLSYLVEHGNLARSPRETEARSIKEYLTNRARYQLTQRGELVHRSVEELLSSTETAREVSSEMLGGILAGLHELAAYDEARLAATPPEVVARQISTLFAQFERLVESTRDFYTYLSQVLLRHDLGREDFQTFKTALLNYLQRFVDDIARHMPQIAVALHDVGPSLDDLLGRADSGERLVGLDGAKARRSTGLDRDDWAGLQAWFLGEPGRVSDAVEVRTLATQAMRALLANLRRIAGTGEREVSRYAELVRLAGWFDAVDDATAHALWAGAFGLYSCRHLGFAADSESDPVPATASWWRAPVADVPVTLRTSGERAVRGKGAPTEDFAEAKARRLAERRATEQRRSEALAELSRAAGRITRVRLSDEARAELLALYSTALAAAGGPLGEAGTAATELPDAALRLVVQRSPDETTVVSSPAGTLRFAGTALTLEAIAEVAESRQDQAG